MRYATVFVGQGLGGKTPNATEGGARGNKYPRDILCYQATARSGKGEKLREKVNKNSCDPARGLAPQCFTFEPDISRSRAASREAMYDGTW